MSSFYIFTATTILFWSAILVWRNIRRPACDERMSVLKKRLRDYAAMKQIAHILPERPTEDQHTPLPPAEHEILLGILKKVEAKNGVLATIWSLFFAGTITAASAGAFAATQSYSCLNGKAFAAAASLFIIMGIPFLLASIVGTRQIDNFLSNGWRDIQNPRASAVLLQKTLMEDALLKEELLWISQRAAVIYAFALPILLTIALWISVFCEAGVNS